MVRPKFATRLSSSMAQKINIRTVKSKGKEQYQGGRKKWLKVGKLESVPNTLTKRPAH